jgi:hypothetical protein
MRWSLFCVVLQVALLRFPHPAVSNAVTLSLSSTRVSANVALTGKFTPSGYVPPHSSLLITLPGTNFPSGSTLASASVSVLAQKASSNKLLFEKFTSLTLQGGTDPPIRNDLLLNGNYQNNGPASLDYRSSMDFGQSSPTNEEYFGYRITGALCPSVSGTYSFMVYNNDDSFELYLRDDEASSNDAQFQQVVQFALPPPYNSGYPKTFNYNLLAGRKYALIALFIERTQGDANTLLWQVPGAAGHVEIPHDAFCTGWARMTGNVLRVFFTWPLMPNTDGLVLAEYTL